MYDSLINKVGLKIVNINKSVQKTFYFYVEIDSFKKNVNEKIGYIFSLTNSKITRRRTENAAIIQHRSYYILNHLQEARLQEEKREHNLKE